MRTKIICELASSWNGDPDLLKALIKAAAENGGDLVKVQDYRAERVPDSDPDKARYQKYQMPDELYPQFIKWCEEFSVRPLITCFNADRAEYLAGLGLKTIKLASISLTNHDLILAAGSHFEEVIASTAMHTYAEIEEAIDVLASNAHRFTVMACVANYPTALKDARINRIDYLKKMVDGQEYASVGYSDHALDVDVSKAALAKGITYLEKHFTLSRYLPQIPHQMYVGGPLITTHQIAIEPHELRELADWRDKVSEMFSQSDESMHIEDKIKSRYDNRYGK